MEFIGSCDTVNLFNFPVDVIHPWGTALQTSWPLLGIELSILSTKVTFQEKCV